DFIQSDLLDYAKNNPGVVVYLKPRRHRSPRVIAEYLNGHRELISLDDFSKEDVYRWSEYLRMREGMPPMRFIKPQRTDNPSIQGPWTPFTHEAPEINLAKIPSEELGRAHNLPPTATEIILEMQEYAKQIDSNPSETGY
ncbi:large ribosomal subunit protein mL43-like, partial [Artemia franciscana]|uniref:large ribosomal subunit protein mL43-like n=1 Tax=Artemia franciscana TaxID=6661 RepID=UPI0032DB7229